MSHAKNSHKNSAQTFAWLMTFYNPAHIREIPKTSQGCPFVHGYTFADCKILERYKKSQEYEVCFLENTRLS